jgi:hypothetical protein
MGRRAIVGNQLTSGDDEQSHGNAAAGFFGTLQLVHFCHAANLSRNVLRA